MDELSQTSKALEHRKRIEDFQQKIIAFQKRFVEAVVEFKENRENIFKITNPSAQ